MNQVSKNLFFTTLYAYYISLHIIKGTFPHFTATFFSSSVEVEMKGNLSSHLQDSRKRGAGGPTGDLQRASGFRVAAPAAAAPEAITPELHPEPDRSFHPSSAVATTAWAAAAAARVQKHCIDEYHCMSVTLTVKRTETSPLPGRRAASLYVARGRSLRRGTLSVTRTAAMTCCLFLTFSASFFSIRTVITRTATVSLLVGHFASVRNEVFFEKKNKSKI